MIAEAGDIRGPTLRRLGCVACIAFAVAALIRCVSQYEEFRAQAASMTTSTGLKLSRGGCGSQGAENATTTDDLAARNASCPRGEWAAPSPAPSSAPSPRSKPKKSPHHVYTCGYGNLFAMGEPFANLATALFPEANTSHWDENHPWDRLLLDDLRPDDVLIWPCGGACPFYPTMEMTTLFPGTILTVNGESSSEKCGLGPPRDNVFPLDYIGIDTGDPSVNYVARNRSRAIATYFAAFDLASMPKQMRQIVFDPIQRAAHTNTGERFLIYATSNCVYYREEAFKALSQIGDAYYGGRCTGRTVAPYQAVGLPDEETQRGGWTENMRHYRRYRFALVMENDAAGGYVTEKIINAFVAGAIPVYFGTREIFDLFNPRAFVFYDISNPQPAVDLVAHLEANRTAYLSMLHEPIVAHGDDTIARYFSLHEDDPGAGHLKWTIRELVGFG
jgi:Glycosyltransferase family 10 (fucosyltransferase) C-term